MTRIGIGHAGNGLRTLRGTADGSYTAIAYDDRIAALKTLAAYGNLAHRTGTCHTQAKSTIVELVERKGIPEGWLRIPVQKPGKDGSITNSTEEGGGILLAMKRAEITVGSLARVFEGKALASEQLLAACGMEGDQPSCAIRAWRVAADRIRESLAAIAVRDLANQIVESQLEEASWRA